MNQKFIGKGIIIWYIKVVEWKWFSRKRRVKHGTREKVHKTKYFLYFLAIM